MIRNINLARTENYDAIIVGGGFYGIMIAYEASCRGLKTLLLEQKDFGSATSFNSLRIVHGGLRYLQSLDIHRFKESVGERKWFMKNFPNLTKPISCLMPLYNKGLQRNSIMWAALNLNDLLSVTRNKEVPIENNLLNGKVISREKVKHLFPDVDTNELKGGAIWNDGAIDDSQLVLFEILKAASENGCTPLNYVEVENIIESQNEIKGVIAVDSETGTEIEFRSPIVINSTGPWSRSLSKKFHKEYKELFKYSIAWNVLFDVNALSDHALAITPPKDNAKAYFLRPWKGKLFAGTVHETWENVEDNPMPSRKSLDSFIADLNLSIPNINLKRKNILQIYSGLLPAKDEDSNQIAVREIIIDHSKDDGPKGLYSLSGVKLTTSRLVAEKIVNKIFDSSSKKKVDLEFPIKTKIDYGIFEFDWDPNSNLDWEDVLRYKIENESVLHLADLLLRRTTIGDNPKNALKYAKHICNLFDWDDERTVAEISALKNYYFSRGFELKD